MSKKRVVTYNKLPDAELARLESEFDVVRFDQPGGPGEGNADFAAALREAHGLIGASLTVGDDLLGSAEKLEAISTISVGYDQFDVPGLTRRGIVLTNTPDVLTEAVADTIFALVLAVARRVVELAEWVKAGHWKTGVGVAEYGTEVNGKTLGIVGMGRIGAAVGRRAHLGFQMPVLYHNRSQNPEAEKALSARYCTGLEELLRACDFVCVVLPLTPETEKRFGATEFAQMKPGAFFINGSRGRVVDEAALIAALTNHQIAGAGLDVFEKEPMPTDSPLLKMSNVVALPHIGSATHETRYGMARCAVSNLIDALAGRRPRDVVNPEAFAHRK